MEATGRPLFIELGQSAQWSASVAFMPLGERRRHLEGILPSESQVISPALSVENRGHHLFELMREHDLSASWPSGWWIRTAPGYGKGLGVALSHARVPRARSCDVSRRIAGGEERNLWASTSPLRKMLRLRA